MKNLRFTVPLFLLEALQFLLQHTNLVWVWIGIVAWEASTGAAIPRDVKWGLYGGAFVVSSFWSWRKAVLRACKAESALAASKKNSSPVRRFVEDSEAVLDRHGHSGMFAEKRMAEYFGQWISVSGAFEGTVDGIVDDAIYLSLTRENGRRLQLLFPAEAREQLRLLREGQQLIAACQIRHGYGAGVFTLENCELVRVEPLRSPLSLAS